MYSEGNREPWIVFRLQGGAAKFRYGDSEGRWHTVWPPTNADKHRTPRQVRLITPEDRTLLLASLDLSADPVPNYREQF